MYENLNVYRGCTFDCSISLVDRKQDPYFLAEGDKLIFGVKDSLKVEPKTNTEPEDVIRKELTIDDAIAGKYYFRLSPEETSKPTQRYFYYVAIELADGDRYQVAPYSEFNVKMPIAISNEKSREIIGQVPRIMRRKSCKSIKEQILDYVKAVYSEKNHAPVRIRNFGNLDIMIVNNSLDHDCITSEELLNILAKKADCFDSENYIVIGFTHAQEALQNDWQAEYNAAIREVFGERFFDLESYIKEPVYSDNHELFSSKALQIAGITSTENDLQHIALSEYPECILHDTTHFNDTGYDIVAEILAKEAESYGV